MDTHLPRAQNFAIVRPERVTSPVIVASPHSGRYYDPSFLQASRLDRIGLRKSEDSFVDELLAEVPGLGVPLLMAHFPRAYCDVNREAWELDPSMFEDKLPAHVNTASPRVAAGLGTIAKVVASGEPIYRGKLTFAEAERRIVSCWMPYHRALAGLIEETRARFGGCLLLDFHSMPGTGPGTGPGSGPGTGPGSGPESGPETGTSSGPATAPGCGMPRRHGPDSVLGDAFGTSCTRPLTEHLERSLRQQGLSVKRNDPYAGGYITRSYGRPREHVHAVQIEIARPLYMNEQRIEKHSGFAAIRTSMTELVRHISMVAKDHL
jgi:N-formylglutamate amidohydrolase